MKVLTKKMLNVLLAFVMVFSFALSGWGGICTAISVTADSAALEKEFTNDGQFNVSQYGANTLEYVEGVTGASGAALKINVKGAGSAYIIFNAPTIKASFVESIVVRIYSPGYSTSDSFRASNPDVSAGWLMLESKDMSSWCDVTLSDSLINQMKDANGYLSKQVLFGARVHGTATEYYIDSITVNMKATTKVTYTGVHSYWNNYFFSDNYCSIVEFSGGIGVGGLDGDYSDVLAKATLNGEPVDSEKLSFVCRAWIDGGADSIIMQWAFIPADGSIFHIPAGAKFTNGGADTNIYEFAQDMYLISNGTIWTQPVSETYYVYESLNPEILHTCKTTQNIDGSFTYTLPAYTREGKVLLGYVMNLMVDDVVTQTFLPAGEYTTTATGCAFIALWGEFTMLDGAAIRIASAETSGIRWTTTIDEEGFNNIAYWARDGYTFGTELSADGFAENFDIPAKQWKEENRVYTGVLTDINASYYNTAFTARGYVDITYANGVTKRIYAQANDTTRSIKQVAELAIASGNYSGTQLSILQQIAGV